MYSGPSPHRSLKCCSRGAADTSHGVANTGTFTAFTSFLAIFVKIFLVFSDFLGAKKHFFQKVLKKWSSIQKK